MLHDGRKMIQTEARTIAVLKCGFFVDDEQLGKVASLIFGKHRVEELTGLHGDYDMEDLGEILVEQCEDVWGIKHGCMDVMTLEECTCRNCGHEDYYMIQPVDTPQTCSKCGAKDSVFLPKVDDDMID